MPIYKCESCQSTISHNTKVCPSCNSRFLNDESEDDFIVRSYQVAMDKGLIVKSVNIKGDTLNMELEVYTEGAPGNEPDWNDGDGIKFFHDVVMKYLPKNHKYSKYIGISFASDDEDDDTDYDDEENERYEIDYTCTFKLKPGYDKNIKKQITSIFEKMENSNKVLRYLDTNIVRP